MIFKHIRHKIMTRLNPVKYYRSLGMRIGEDCEIYSSVNFGSEPYLISLGDHVRITDGVQFVTHDGGVWVLRDMDKTLRDADLFGAIEVGNNVHIGLGAVIMPGVHIGNNCIIGCSAVVTKDIPDNSIAAGIPARVIETVAEYKEKNRERCMSFKALSAAEKKVCLERIFKHG